MNDNQMTDEQQAIAKGAKKAGKKLGKNRLVKKIRNWAIVLFLSAIGIVLTFMFFIALFTATTQQSCFTNNAKSTGKAIGGDWKDSNSDTHKAMVYAAGQFKDKLGMSGNNISAALAIGLRESGFNPAAVNPSGAVKGIYQWGTGGINGNRYGNTSDTVESQIDLAVHELQTSHSATLTRMKDADLSGSLEAWDVYFEGVGVNDPQRKAAETLATAQEIQKIFMLNFPGNVKFGENESLTGATTGSAVSGIGSDQSNCDTSVSTGTTDGLPVAGQYRITGGYPNYDGASGAPHGGVDFQTVVHTTDGPESNVYAVTDGTVVSKSSDPVGGNHVVIQAPDGTFTYYGHAPTLDAIVVNVGDKVKKGQHISHEGQTGEATGIHVHFGYNKEQHSFGPSAKGLTNPAELLKNLPADRQTNGTVTSDMSEVYNSKDSQEK